MRVIGSVDTHLGLGLHDHLCWVHDDPADYRSRLSGFLGEGLDQGLRVVYVGSGPTEGLRKHLTGLSGLGDQLARDAVRLLSSEDVYGVGTPVDPADVVRQYAAATEEALADGYLGLRATADVTDVVRTPEHQDAFARYEFLIERYMSQHPLSGMCAYRSEIGTAARRFASLHPIASGGLTPFRVYACDDGAVGLAGEAELSGLPELEGAFDHLTAVADEGDIVIDMSLITFADHQALLALSGFADRSPSPVAFRSVPAIARRVADLLRIELPGAW